MSMTFKKMIYRSLYGIEDEHYGVKDKNNGFDDWLVCFSISVYSIELIFESLYKNYVRHDCFYNT